jgi:hypothetical protein
MYPVRWLFNTGGKELKEVKEEGTGAHTLSFWLL